MKKINLKFKIIESFIDDDNIEYQLIKNESGYGVKMIDLDSNETISFWVKLSLEQAKNIYEFTSSMLLFR